MKFSATARAVWKCRRTPQGVRGLKFHAKYLGDNTPKSHPARGAWIEISHTFCPAILGAPSHPARGAWIEMLLLLMERQILQVAPRKGCVD